MTNEITLSRRSRPARFLAVWVLANLVGGFITGFLESNGLQFMATLVLTGAIVGTLQWLVLRPWGGFRWWPLASTIGWIVSTLINSLSDPLTDPIVTFLWNQVGLWEVFWLNVVNQPLWILGMAIAQALVLRQRGRPVKQWLLASLVGAASQGAVSASLCAAFCQALPLWLVGIVNGLGWATYGLVTGFVAHQFTGQNPSEETV